MNKLALVIGVIFIFEVKAQDFLEDTVLTASRIEQNHLEVPFSVSFVGSDEINESQLRTIPEALLRKSGVLVQKTTHGHGSPFIRGFTGRQNALLVDGVKMNNSTWRSGPIQYWSTLDAQGVEELELVKGPGSVMYGSDSLGGTLNVMSKGSRYKEEKGSFSKGSIFYQYDTNSESHVSRFEQRFGVGNDFGMSVGMSMKFFGDVKDSYFGRMKNTGYSEKGFDWKFEKSLNSTTELIFAYQAIDQDDVWRWHSTIYNPGWVHGSHQTAAGNLKYRIYDQERSLTYAKLKGSEASSWIEDWEVILSFQKSQDSEERPNRYTVADVKTYGLSFQNYKELKDVNSVIFGVDLYYDDVNADGNEPKRRPVADGSNYLSLGLFGQYSRGVTKNLKMEFGGRASYFHAKWDKGYDSGTQSDESGSGDWSNLSFSTRANYALSDDSSLFGGISQGFRAPNLKDLTGSEIAFTNTHFFGASDLNPEKTISLELGVKRQTPALEFSSSIYYTLLNDPIVQIADGTTNRLINGESALIGGVEFEGNWEMTEQWNLRVHFNYQDGKDKVRSNVGGTIKKDTIKRLAPLSGSLALRRTFENFWVEFSTLFATTQDNLRSTDTASDNERIPTNGTPHYIVTSLRGNWQATDALKLNLAFTNLTDEDYRIHGSGVNEQGFNTTFGIEYSW